MNLDWTDEDMNDYFWGRKPRLSIIAVMETKLYDKKIGYRTYFAPIFSTFDNNNYIYLN